MRRTPRQGGSLLWFAALAAWVLFLLLATSLHASTNNNDDDGIADEGGFDDGFLLQPPPPSPQRRPKQSSAQTMPLLALVLSDARPESAERRAAIRASWCAPEQLQSTSAKNATKCVFVLSATPYGPAAEAALGAEHAAHGDLLRVDTGGLPDAWEALPAKVFAALRWAQSADFSGAAALLKTDHDCYADLAGIARGAAALGARHGALFYWGSFYRGARPKASAGDRYYDPLWANKSARYPPYAAGPGYVLSPALAARLAAWDARRLPSVLEDVCVGHAVGALAASAVRVHDPWRFVSQRAPVCVPGMLLKHCALHLNDIPRYTANLRVRGDPCRSRITLVDPL